MPARMALEDMNLAEWYALTHTFALLVSLTDVEDMKTYLARLEPARPFKDKASKRMCSGSCTGKGFPARNLLLPLQNTYLQDWVPLERVKD